MVRQAHYKMKSKILQKDSPILRRQAKVVTLKDIKSKKVHDILRRMKEALYGEDDGVAIAAPQIGESLRIFLVRGNILDLLRNKKNADKSNRKQTHPQKDLVFINPEIIKKSKSMKKVEEGCLSVRWLYGLVKRVEKVTIRSYDESGKLSERGASGLLAQIFQHETDHLDGILFIDKAEDLQEIPPAKLIKFVFFGGSQFSKYVLEELETYGLSPVLQITDAKSPLPLEKLKNLKADAFIVASFGKILPKDVLDLAKHKTLNIHPSLLPELRGATPIQSTILGQSVPGVTIMRLDEKMDHGPILAQAKVLLDPWPDHYRVVEEKLGRVGGQLLAEIMRKWITGEIKESPQDEAKATYTKLVKKEDGLLDLNGPVEENYRKVLAYSTWPGAYTIFKNKRGKEIRLIIKDAEVIDGKFIPTKVTPTGKREMSWQDFLRGN